MAKQYKIYPPIGIARLGDAPAERHFVGPEIPGRSAELDAGPFRADGKIRPQGTRFRVFAFDAGDPLALPEEVQVGGDIAEITWTVHLANKKAYWHEFHGRVGETSPDIPPAQVRPYPPDRLRNFRPGESDASRRGRLIIDSRPRTLSASGAEGRHPIAKGTSAEPGKETWPQPFVDGRKIDRLGDLFVSREGHLIVVGGAGISGTIDGSPIPDYANNDGWFDDVSDGPVRATVVFKSGAPAEADAAWVIVGSPRFAPSAPCVVTLHDAIDDVAVRYHGFRPALYDVAARAFKTDYEPSFTDEVYPILRAAELVQWLLEKADGSPVEGMHAWDYASLGANPYVGDSPTPEEIFGQLRKPADWNKPPTQRKMPRLHGDEGVERSFLTLTETQYFILSQWKEGKFKAGGVPDIPPATTPIRPDGLLKAALENCVGGAFFPGIEAGWIMRDPRIFFPNDPFRIRVLPDGQERNPLGLAPGGATMRSALPWQADFQDCADQWWPSHRPTDVFVVGSTAAQPERWARNIPEDDPDPNLNHLNMVKNWQRLEFVLSLNRDAKPPLGEVPGGGEPDVVPPIA